MKSSKTMEYHKSALFEMNDNDDLLNIFVIILGNSQRKGSTSYSLSGQNDIIQELTKRQILVLFFKQKFQKQRSYNSTRSDNVCNIYIYLLCF